MAISEKHWNQKQTEHTEATDAERRAERSWAQNGLDSRTLADGRWQAESDSSEDIVAALRGFFLTHTLDPLTGEVYTVH